jgi:hypothetical protein
MSFLLQGYEPNYEPKELYKCINKGLTAFGIGIVFILVAVVFDLNFDLCVWAIF